MVKATKNRKSIRLLFVEKGKPAHAFDLAFNLRQVDKYEIAMMGLDPLNALLAPFRYKREGVITYTVHTHDDKIACMFGVVSSRNPKMGSIWMLASPELEKHWKYFTKRTKNWVNFLLTDYEYVHNIISKENKISIKWLKWLGFSFKSVAKNNNMLYFYKKIHRVSRNIQPVLGDIGPQWITEVSLDRTTVGFN